MNTEISLLTVKQEIEDADEYCKSYNINISSIDEINQRFTVLMRSLVDKEQYIIQFGFDDYPEKPYLIDFIHPETKEAGKPNCYPEGGDNFFHPNGLICHPCSRKAYAGYTGVHSEWSMLSWRENAGGLKNLKGIIDCIFSRISDKTYYKRRRK